MQDMSYQCLHTVDNFMMQQLGRFVQDAESVHTAGSSHLDRVGILSTGNVPCVCCEYIDTCI